MRGSALAFLFYSVSALAKISANVPADYSNYLYVDRLEAYGCAKPTYRGFRPQAHSDLRQSLWLEDSKAKEKEECQAPKWLVAERDLIMRPSFQNDVRVGLLFLHDENIPLEGIDATVTPSFPLRGGRPFFYGPNLAAEFVLNAEGGEDFGLAVSLTPGWNGGLQDYESLRGKFYLHEGYFKVGYRRLEVTYGRTLLGLGSSRHGSLLLSQAAKPVNLWKLALRPSRTAEILGPLSFETWIADQGARAGIANSKLWGIGLGVRPFSFVELSLFELYQFGGVGAPGLETSDYLAMLAYSGDDKLTPKRQRGMVVDLSIWGPSKYAKLYAQFFFDKPDDVSTLVGLWFPKVGSAEIRLEYVNLQKKAYQHPFWTQGFTIQGSPLGHPVGPGGQAFYVDVGLPSLSDWRPAVGLSYESRGKSMAGARHAETRYGAGLELQRRWGPTELVTLARYSRIQDHLYVRGDDVAGFSAATSLRYSFF